MSDGRKNAYETRVEVEWISGPTAVVIGALIGFTIYCIGSIESKLTQTNAKLSSIESIMESAMKARMK